MDGSEKRASGRLIREDFSLRAPVEGEAVLDLDRVSRRFGGVVAVKDVSLSVRSGELVGLIGPNGAGKTTIFNLITGVYPATGGSVRVLGEVVNGVAHGARKPSEITARGVARTFQNIRLFDALSVVDNVKVAYTHRARCGLTRAVLGTPAQRREEAEIEERALEFLDLFGLKERAAEPARSLPYGERRRLEIARALATEPRLLLLDEPAAGFNPAERTELLDLVRWIRDEFRLTILLIEHDMKFVMSICERLYVLDHGERIAEGKPDAIRRNPEVIRAYLGAGAAAEPAGPAEGAG